ncbi:sulfotransferase [Halioxenophilus aromaticivorans]
MKVKDIIIEAEAITGLKANLPDDAINGLTQLVKSIVDEAPLSEQGLQSSKKMILNNLANRIRVDHYLEQHPELLQQAIETPTFVFGLPRTGTTLLINLLAEDPARRAFIRWESLNSVPPPKASEVRTDPRYFEAQALIEQSLKYVPHISAIHHENADSPTECQFSMSQTFCSQLFESMIDIPSYRKWFLSTDYLPAFKYHKRLLQLLQTHAPGQWTLKNPWHPLYLTALKEVFPDAQLIMTHRDPVEVVGSACSLIKHVRLLTHEHVDLEKIGSTTIDIFQRMIDNIINYKVKYGENSIYDIQYQDIIKNPTESIHNIYRHFNQPLTNEAKNAMKKYLTDNPKGKHGKHEYILEEFGLNEAYIRSIFSDYYDRFLL